jgi:flagellar assembly factor FliW
MIIETKKFGFVEIGEEDIITFPHSVYGFEGTFRYVLLKDKTKPENPFMWLQCVDGREPCFAVVNPGTLFADYAPVIAAEDQEAISLGQEEFLRFLVIATVPGDISGLFFNLKCPVAVNSEKNIAKQVILDNSDYPVKYYYLQKRRDGDAGSDPPCR